MLISTKCRSSLNFDDVAFTTVLELCPFTTEKILLNSNMTSFKRFEYTPVVKNEYIVRMFKSYSHVICFFMNETPDVIER